MRDSFQGAFKPAFKVGRMAATEALVTNKVEEGRTPVVLSSHFRKFPVVK